MGLVRIKLLEGNVLEIDFAEGMENVYFTGPESNKWLLGLWNVKTVMLKAGQDVVVSMNDYIQIQREARK